MTDINEWLTVIKNLVHTGKVDFAQARPKPKSGKPKCAPPSRATVVYVQRNGSLACARCGIIESKAGTRMWQRRDAKRGLIQLCRICEIARHPSPPKVVSGGKVSPR
jgi:hypothetical protein